MAGSEVKADLWINEYITPWDIYSHGITRILSYKKTPYQEMYIVESGAYGKALVLDGKWQSCTGDEFIYHEALVQPGMIAHQNPKTVLILGGGEGATTREVLRWNTVERVMMIDIDGEVVQACKDHLPEMHANSFDDPRFELVIADALEVLETTTEKWDIIISDLTDPIEEGPSFALFAKEYFEKLQRVLAPGGYVIVQSGPVSVPNVKYHARLINTLKTVFPHVLSYITPTAAYGSPWGLALCTPQPVNTRPDPHTIDQLLKEKTSGGLRLIDGVSLLGMLQTPLYIRTAIEEYQEIYSLETPPEFFGKGSKE
ncbi:Spermine synthase [Gloeothece citriformis PCC 7424]|uniref:Polyamine aminopropyltransferase n=1 Tax=Gloeothece citriformis (strain PCC 7424) TaxID=65393 RepID=B7KFJ0_GLOC7|nr:methyltransferase domain-containing protein [Gloeothece citriformis]ACK73315.1 Spermine synthase [Gloeothece citriformis PCC 7424]